MKKSIVIVFLAITLSHFTSKVSAQGHASIASTVNCQDTIPKAVEIGRECEDYIIVMQEPGFKEGYEADFINKNIVYPKAAKRRKIEGTVVISLIISSEGTVSELNVLSELPKGCTEEAIRVVKLMNDKWKPGKLNGVPVTSVKIIKVKFSLPNN
jgi:protein TonB